MATLFSPGGLSFSSYVTWLTYLLMAITGSGYLALMWSTVVLLGGFVTSLHRKDFWSITIISMVQAARIFNDFGDRLVPKLFSLLNSINLRSVFAPLKKIVAFQTRSGKPIPRSMIIWLRIFGIFCAAICYMSLLAFLAVCYIVVFVYGYLGPTICIEIALLRILKRDYASNDGDITKANLAPALDLFYCLILCQGALYMIWLFFLAWGAFLFAYLRRAHMLPIKWLVDYLIDTRAKCWRNPASIEGSTISRYAAELIDSESRDDQFSGLTMLATFIRQGADVSSLLLISRPRVQRVIDTLGLRCGAFWELRKAAACVVAQLAHHIHLAQFPGAILCISTLLQDETTLRYWRNRQPGQVSPQLRDGGSTMLVFIHLAEKLMPKAPEQEDHRHHDQHHKKCVLEEDDGGCNELILQGLTILERLASDRHNCVEISSTPEVISQILAPLCSDTLIHRVKKNSEWAEIVNGTFKVLHNLIRCPGLTGESLRRDIAAREQAIRNLESILEQSNDAGHQELQIRAMEILTELGLDSSTNLTMETKQNLIKKQLQIFLDEDSASTFKELKATAGTTLVMLTSNSEENSSIVNGSFGRLTEMLDAKNNTTYRMMAAQILENICARCDLDKERVKDKLLPQVLDEIMPNKREPPQPAEENQQIAAPPVEDEENQNIAPGIDEESQNNTPGNDDVNHNISAQEGNTEIQEISSTTEQKKSLDQGNDEQIGTKEVQEAFLSLTLVIYDKLISTDDFDEAVQKKSIRNGEFVLKLKTILEENCNNEVTSLRIVKLCGQIAASMLLRNQYTEHFKNQGFVQHLSEATKNMSNLESCILFAGTDPGLKKIAKPLLSELENEVLRFVG